MVLHFMLIDFALLVSCSLWKSFMVITHIESLVLRTIL